MSLQGESTIASRRLEYIDALRGLAALMVLWFHAVQQGTRDLPLWIARINNQLARGVQLFYLVSAFTLFLTLASRQKSGDFSNLNFFLRRFFRIAPLFYFALALYLWLYGFAPRVSTGNHPITFLNILSNVFFVNGFNPYWINSIVPVGWSVAVEMNFYLLVPLLFRYINTLRRSILFFLVSLIFSLIVNYLFAVYPLINSRHVWDEFRFQWIVNQLPIFSLGIVLFYLLNYSSKFSLHSGKILISSIFLILLSPWVKLPLIPLHVQYGVAFLSLAFSLAQKPVIFLVNSFFIYLGKISYSMYLLHVIGIRIVLHQLGWLVSPQADLLSGVILFPLLVLAVTVLISSITYRLIEVPGQKIGKKLITRQSSNIQV